MARGNGGLAGSIERKPYEDPAPRLGPLYRLCGSRLGARTEIATGPRNKENRIEPRPDRRFTTVCESDSIKSTANDPSSAELASRLGFLHGRIADGGLH